MHATLVQICPPGTGGVRDYADSLARAWAARGVDSHVIEGTRAGLAPQLAALPRAGANGARLCIVLHFSGYGYAPRGLCGWLADELSRFKAAHGAGVRLVVVFHELFAAGEPVWRSAFWLARWQSQAARRIARLADSLWTNAEFHAAWLREVVDDTTPLQVRPVFSSVGEPEDPTPWNRREPRAIVFGSTATRARAFVALRACAPALARLGIQEIVEAGDGASQSGEVAGMPTRRLGRLSASELGALLAGSRFALIDYPSRFLGKSSVFAGYAANGCAAINTFALDRDFDGLRMGVHYINLRAPFEADADALAQTAQRLHRWYRGHALALQSRELLEAANADPAQAASPAFAAAPR